MTDGAECDVFVKRMNKNGFQKKNPRNLVITKQYFCQFRVNWSVNSMTKIITKDDPQTVT